MKMKRSICVVLALLLMCAMSVAAFASNGNSAIAFDQRVISKIDGSRIVETLRYLSVDIGPRPVSSPEERQAAEYLAAKYEEYGYDVEIQEFARTANTAYLRTVGEEVQRFPLQVGSRSVLTSGDGITAYVVDCGLGRVGDFPAEVSGNIALVQRGTETFANMAARAKDAGAVGIIFQNNTWQRFSVNVNTTIPYATLNYDEGERVKATGGLMNFQVNQYTTSQNVIATKKPKKNWDTGEVVVVVAHYDSVPTSPGASDNGSGTAVMLEIARALSDTPVEKEIRFLAVGGEESGYLGTYAYLNSLTQEEIDRIIAAFNMDMIGTAGEGQNHILVGTVDGSNNLVAQTVRAAVERLGYGDILVAPFTRGSSDHVPFHNLGIPAGNTTWRGPNGELEPWYHHPYDTFERCSPERMEIGAKVVAMAVHDIARKSTPSLEKSATRRVEEAPVHFDEFVNIENLGGDDI